MKIKSFKYKNKDKNWEIEEVNFNNINLIVGQNATGKTRVIEAIKNLSSLLCGNKATILNEIFEILLREEESNIEYKYYLEKEGINIIKEKFEEIKDNNKKLLLERDKKGEGKIFSTKENNDIEFGIQNTQLAIVFKNDKIHHNYIKKIVGWAENSIFYAFAGNLGKLDFYSLEEREEDYSLKDTEKVVKNYVKAREKHGKKLDEKIIFDLKKIGYSINKIGTLKISKLEFLYVKEDDLKKSTYQYEMSQGMFRALSIIIQLNICIIDNKGELIVIDDIGEGLDYERSTNLINLIIEKIKESKGQVLMTTNDRFVMNNVALEFWQVIKRENGNIKFYNIINSKENFEDFEYTGLNNFDFLARKFYLGENNEN